MSSDPRPMLTPEGAWIYPGSHVDASARVSPGICVGLPPAPDDDCQEYRSLIARVGPGCYLAPYSVIYQGGVLDRDVYLDCYCRIGCHTFVGAGTRVLYGARVHNDVRIGEHCIIGGNCSNGVRIGNNVTHMGRIAHKYNAPRGDWASIEEPSPVIEDYAVVGANALIVGPLTIGRKSYVAAGEVVRKSVPPKSVVYRGQVYRASEWKGELARNGFFDD